MKIFKTMLCIFLSLTLLAGMAACGGEGDSSTEAPSDNSASTSLGAASSDGDKVTSSADSSAESGADSSAINESSDNNSSETASGDTSDETSSGNTSGDDTSGNETSDDTTSGDTSDNPHEPSIPVGTKENPADLVIGDNKAKAEGSGEYFYSWTAAENAVLVLQLSGAGKTGWAYRAENLTAGSEFTKLGKSSDSDAVSTVYMTVFGGDEILVAVNTDTGAAGDVTVNASLLEAWGTESNGIPIKIGQTDYLRVPAGKTVYFHGRTQNTTMVLKGDSNSVLEFNGESYKLTKGKLELEMPKSEGGKVEALIFAITNNSKNTQIYSVTCNYPLGTSDNPAKAKLGGNSVQIEAGNQYGYIYEWTATEKGSVTITVTGNNWHYEILNINTMAQEQSTSKDSSPVKEASIKVRSGQVVRITVNSGDGKEAKVTFDLSFEKAE